MKKDILIILFVLISQRICAQCDLVFENKRVVSVCFADYSLKNNGDSCILQYNASQITADGHFYDINSSIYKELMEEMQSLLNEISHNRIPIAEYLDINTSILKEYLSKDSIQKNYYDLFLEPDDDDCLFILNKYQSLDLFASWLHEEYPIIDSGVFLINTAHDPRGIKIAIQTDMRTYYFDMRDIEIFQPYLMRTSDKDCLRFITNFNVNKHIRNLFKVLNIHRNVPWRDEVIESYILFCAKDYRI